jgi:Rps23 Pro-64 3,4-dihydroxylase Tpa1-like proline 4-hydroxylase|tara:strand:+ start:147 stop:716 length:570 start_codon:yes stop_codon:yes gene_type:complete
MSNVKDFIQISDHVFDPTFISYMVRYFNTQENFRDASIVSNKGNEVDKKIRDVKDYPLSKNRSELTSVYINNIVTDTVLAGIRQYSGKHPFVQVANLDLSVLKYGVGGHYKWHVDAGTTLNRSLSVIITLNNDYEGGNLLFSPTQEKEDQITIKPGVGKMIIWPSNFMYPHQVEPITKGKRYSIVGWLW